MQALKFLRKHISELLVVLLASLLSFKKNGLFILLQNQTFFLWRKSGFCPISGLCLFIHSLIHTVEAGFSV